jgi:hypothetical protein
MVEEISPNEALHVLGLTYEAPGLLTSAAVVSPIEDFAVLYRMSTGIYGQPGFRRFDQPFPYARPYLHALHYGSPFDLQVVVPTAILLGSAKWSLPALLNLVKQALLLPGGIPKERSEKQRADLADAELRPLRPRKDAAEFVDHMDAETAQAIRERYGQPGLVRVLDVARRAEAGPVRPRSLRVEPVSDPERYPPPPADFEPPPVQGDSVPAWRRLEHLPGPPAQ